MPLTKSPNGHIDVSVCLSVSRPYVTNASTRDQHTLANRPHTRADERQTAAQPISQSSPSLSLSLSLSLRFSQIFPAPTHRPTHSRHQTAHNQTIQHDTQRAAGPRERQSDSVSQSVIHSVVDRSADMSHSEPYGQHAQSKRHSTTAPGRRSGHVPNSVCLSVCQPLDDHHPMASDTSTPTHTGKTRPNHVQFTDRRQPDHRTTAILCAANEPIVPFSVCLSDCLSVCAWGSPADERFAVDRDDLQRDTERERERGRQICRSQLAIGWRVRSLQWGRWMGQIVSVRCAHSH